MTLNKKINCEELRYESPSATLLYIQSEGVLCQSGEGTIDDATEEDWGLLI